MNDQEPKIYQQLREIAEDATHFNEALRLLAATHKIFIVDIPDGWGVSAHDDAIHTMFTTFSQAFEFALGLLEVKK